MESAAYFVKNIVSINMNFTDSKQGATTKWNQKYAKLVFTLWLERMPNFNNNFSTYLIPCCNLIK